MRTCVVLYFSRLSKCKCTLVLLTPPAHASDQAEADPSTSRHLVGQAQLPQMTTNQSDAGPSDTKQVPIGEPQIPDNNTESPLSSSRKRQLTREELQRKIKKYITRLREYAKHATDDFKGKVGNRRLTKKWSPICIRGF